MRNVNVVFLNGPNTAGKDKQAELLAEGNSRFGILPIGSIFRAAVNGGKHAEKVTPHAPEMQRGKLLPDDVTAEIVLDETQELLRSGHEGVVIPGFPRTEGQLEHVNLWTSEVSESGLSVVTHHVALEVTEPTVIQRAEKRRRKAIARGEEPRIDDDPEIALRRFREYREKTDPVLDSLTNDGELHLVDAEALSNVEVHLEITNKLGIPTTFGSSRERF